MLRHIYRFLYAIHRGRVFDRQRRSGIEAGRHYCNFNSNQTLNERRQVQV